MKAVICCIFLFFGINSVYSNVLKQKEISCSINSSLRDSLYNIIVQTGISVILMDDKQTEETKSLSKESVNLKLGDFCNLIARNQYQWYLSDNNVLIFQKKNILIPALELKMRPEYCITSLQTTELLPISYYLMTKNLMLMVILAEKINYPNFIKNETFLSYLIRVVSNTNTLTIIYKISDKDAIVLWDIFMKQNPNIKKTSDDLFGLFISKNYEQLKKEIAFSGENIADGSSLATCKLKLLEKQNFELSIKNISDQRLNFTNFKAQNLIINDLASDGKFFDINETFLIYPPLDSALPENFYMEPHEEKVFTFPLTGSRSRKNTGKQIWNIGVENKYDFKPTNDCIILKRRNKNYNLYGIVVYFYDSTGKKYKIINRDFVDDTGWCD